MATTDPAAAEAARAAAGHLRRIGDREFLAFAIGNLVLALLTLGEWNAADQVLTQAVDSDGLAYHERITCDRGWLAALRGDVSTAQSMLAALQDLRASEDPQDKATISTVEAFIAIARRQPENALRHARATLTHARAIGISHEKLRWAWPLAARAVYELQDTATTRELLALLDDTDPGQLAPMLRAERDLVRARLSASSGEQAADPALASAVSGLRELSSPYHLAHGLLDHAGYLSRRHHAEAAALAIDEARTIAGQLRCQPLLDRAADLTPAASRIRG